MRPTNEQVDIALAHALRCVEFRIPKVADHRRYGYLHSLALRYGLVGIASIHSLLESTEARERRGILERLPVWNDMVEEHVKWEVIARLPIEINNSTPAWVARHASDSLQTYLPLQRQHCAIDDCLRLASQEYAKLHSHQIGSEWSLFKRRHSLQIFEKTAAESVDFATNFFGRRQNGLEEVAEIALIGE